MTFLLNIFILILLIYAIAVFYGKARIAAADTTGFPERVERLFTYSVIIPFRDEKENLKHILSDLMHLKFAESRFEVIFIDDHSSDGSFENLNPGEFPGNFRLIKASGFGKKQAIHEAVLKATGDYIYTVDADCILPENILEEIDSVIRVHRPGLVVQPVITADCPALICRFQYYDFLSLTGVNAAANRIWGHPVLANGANLVFEKAAYIAVNPYKNNWHIASGDDMFLLQAFITGDNRKILLNYTIRSLIKTQPEKSWFDLMKQRIRWAGKMKSMQGSVAFFLGFLSLAVQIALLGLLVTGLLSGCRFLLVFGLVLFFKSVADFLFIRKVALILGQKVHFFSVLLLEFVYMIFVPAVVLLSLFIHPEWKKRKITH